MRKPFVAGNWKMNTDGNSGVSLAENIASGSMDIAGQKVTVAVCPPFVYLGAVTNALRSSNIAVGAQNIYFELKGAFTGEISASMLKDVGCTYVVIGHSERRQYFGETNETVNKKIKAALAHGLVPIMCIGESLEERESGNTITKVETQIAEGLIDLETQDIRHIIIAYEPIWAIGTGLTATPDQAQEVHSFIRDNLGENHGNEVASCAIILYGGSVKPANTYELLKEKNINGALVGGASLEADSFIQIAKEAMRAYKE